PPPVKPSRSTRQTPTRSARLQGRMTSSRSTAAAGSAARQPSASAAPAIHPRTSAPRFGEELRAYEDLARLGALAGADDPVLLHHVDEPGGLGIAEAHAPLQERDRRLPLADDQPHTIPVEIVPVGAALTPVPAVGLRRQVNVDRKSTR